MKFNYFHCVASSVCALYLFAPCAADSQVLNAVPTRIVGHAANPANALEGLSPTNFNPNLVEGRELYSPQGIALDTSVSPPILYVADTLNNRVLAWKNGSGFTNGSPADLVIGQPDPYTTLPGGPGSALGFTAGLNSPTGLAVRNGDLYVVDSGNNRVLRFPQPFANQGHEQPNLILGQATFSTKVANYPSGRPSAAGISLCCANNQAPYTANIAFDAAGNLWLTDPGNRRVLRFPAAQVSAGGAGLSADYQLGWPNPTDFADAPIALPVNSTGAYTTSQFYVPAGIAFDTAGRLYVTDADPTLTVNRVLVFPLGPTINGLPQLNGTVKIIGLPPQGTTPSQVVQNQTLLLNPSGVFLIPAANNQSTVGVVDTTSSRILIFPPFEQWTDPLVAPPATQVIGQNGDFSNRNPNNAPLATVSPAPTATTLAFPGAAVFVNNVLYVADSLNNRVVAWPYQGGTFPAANGVLGQTQLTRGSINYIEGREFNFNSSVPTAGAPCYSGYPSACDAGIAVDNSSGTPHLYVADPGNNRVLGFKDLRTLTAGSQADIVIGQPDLSTGICNYPTGNPAQPAQNTLCNPIGLTVDAQGNLYVADSLNGRVLEFPQPFNYTGTMQPASLVLGQQSFNSQFTDPTQSNMARPYGVALSGTNGLVVSDVQHNRILFFPETNGSFTNGEPASKVFGQSGFNSQAPGNGANQLNQPHHVSCDTNGLIYVADTANNRVQIFNDPNNPETPVAGASAIYSLLDNFQAPRGVYVSQVTGAIWVTDTLNQGDQCSGQPCSYAVKRYGRYPDQLLASPASLAQIPAAAPSLAVAQDATGNLVVADFSHRIAIYFHSLQVVNGGSFLVTKQLAPGMLATICAADASLVPSTAALDCGTGTNTFGSTTAGATTVPLGTVLADTQVLFNGSPVPLYYVSPTQINFVVPNGQSAGAVPTTGSVPIVVVKPSTGQVLAAGSAAMNSASPAILEATFSGTLRQAAVLNQDNSVNSATNRAARGSIIQIFATGAGFVPGAPPDGVPASSPISTPGIPQVIVGSCLVDDTACTMETGEHVTYSGLDTYPGVWQINVKIPMNTAPGSQVPLFIGMNGIFNTVANQDGFVMTIGVQ
ncbi:MAG TPA: hypothetical protein VKV17_17355 [Bryobacteraceae bacterium]|nr:hypothetical protein [Bryobacteraceae bacterium]